MNELQIAKNDALKKIIENQPPDPFAIPSQERATDLPQRTLLNTRPFIIGNNRNDYMQGINPNQQIPPNCICMPPQPVIPVSAPLPFLQPLPISFPTQPTPIFIPPPPLPLPSLPRLPTPLPSPILPQPFMPIMPPINNCCTLCNSRCRSPFKTKMLVAKTTHVKNPLSKFKQTNELEENAECTLPALKSIINKVSFY